MGRVEEEGSATSMDQACSPPMGHRVSPWYQAHAGLDAVVVNPGDHLQRDGVLAGLHIIHLRRGGWSGGPWSSLPHPRHRKGRKAGDGEEITLLRTPCLLSSLSPLSSEAKYLLLA